MLVSALIFFGRANRVEVSDSRDAVLLVITELFMLSFNESTPMSENRSVSEDLLVLLLAGRQEVDAKLSKDMLLVDLIAATLPLRCLRAAGLECLELSLDECW